jgi:hypothetical protein
MLASMKMALIRKFIQITSKLAWYKAKALAKGV